MAYSNRSQLLPAVRNCGAMHRQSWSCHSLVKSDVTALILSAPADSTSTETPAPAIMAVGTTTSHGTAAADEEARAEVDVLNSRLEKTTQLTKKIRASLSRLEATGDSVKHVVSPLSEGTRKLQVLSGSTVTH